MMEHAINIVISVILFLGGLVFEAVAFIDAFLASLMIAAGIPSNIQLILLIVVAILLMAYAIRALGGLFAILLCILLVLLLLHKAFPDIHVPSMALPTAGTVQT